MYGCTKKGLHSTLLIAFLSTNNAMYLLSTCLVIDFEYLGLKFAMARQRLTRCSCALVLRFLSTMHTRHGLVFLKRTFSHHTPLQS
jgi:hypothetical protein